jgi:hypothetical protein
MYPLGMMKMLVDALNHEQNHLERGHGDDGGNEDDSGAIAKNGNEMTYSVIVSLFIECKSSESPIVETDHPLEWMNGTLS